MKKLILIITFAMLGTYIAGIFVGIQIERYTAQNKKERQFISMNRK